MIKPDQWSGKPAWVVCCPVCDFEYAHHGNVEVFDREREDGPTFIKVPGSSQSIPSAFNPSPRRDAVRIHFRGECGHRWYMDIIQHKGNTFIAFEAES